MQGNDRSDWYLRYAAGVYAVGLTVHTGDHLRRGTDAVTREVFWAGMLLTVISVITLALVFLRQRVAPAVASIVGFTAAVGVTASHLLPHWSSLSDSLPDGSVDAFTWFAVLLEIGGALAMGVAATQVWRSRQVAIGGSAGLAAR